MNLITLAVTAATSLFSISSTASTKTNIHDLLVKDINMNNVNLSDYEGKVLLIVNVASKCGYTKQYTGLQKIYEKYKDQGFVVLGFPCNDFGGQEPGSNEEISDFCSLNFNVTFPMFNKVKVLGNDKHPLFEVLTNNSVTGKSDVKWNFEKFIIDKKGNVVDRFRSITKPESGKITSLIEKELNK